MLGFTHIDFSKLSPSDIVVLCIFGAWGFVSVIFSLDGFEKEPKARSMSGLELLFKHSPPWWRTVTWIVFAIVFINFLLDIVLSKYFKI